MIGTLAVACAAFLLIAGLTAGAGGILAFAHTKLNLVDFGLLLAGALWMAVGPAAHSEAVPRAGQRSRRLRAAAPPGRGGPGWACCAAIPRCGRGPCLTFGLHLTWAVAMGLAALAAMGFRPLIGSGGSLAVAIGLMGALGLLSAAGFGTCVGGAPHPHAHPHRHPHTHFHPNPHLDAHCHCHQHQHPDRHPHIYRHGHPHAHAALGSGARHRRTGSRAPR